MEIDKMSATESAAKAPAKAATEDSAEAGANASNASAEAPGEAVRGTMQRASDQENPPATRRLVTLRYERDGEAVEHLVIVDNGIFNTHINRTCVSKFLWCLTHLAIFSSTFLFALGNTVVVDFQSLIVESFGDVGKLSWLEVGFVLASCATINVWGKLFGIFSTKWLYLVSIVLFGVGNILCGEAVSMDAFVAGRAIAGFGGAGIYWGCLTFMPLLTPPRHHRIYTALVGITFGAGIVLGPIIGGAFAQHANWRWAFRMNFIIGAAFAPIFALFFTSYGRIYDRSHNNLPPLGDPQPGKSFMAKLRQIDYLGAILNVSFMVCLVMALLSGGNTYEWASVEEIALWVVGGVLLLALLVQQKYTLGTTVEQRIFKFSFMEQPILWLSLPLVTASSAVVFIPTYYLPLYCQTIRGDSPMSAAVTLLPFLCTTFATALGAGFGTAYAPGFYRTFYLSGAFACSLGACLLSMVDETTPLSHARAFGVIMGFGAGIYGQITFSLCNVEVPPGRRSDTIGYFLLAQHLGIVIALGVSGTIFQNKAMTELQNLFPAYSPEELRGAIGGIRSDFISNLPDDLKAQALHAIADAMSSIYWIVTAAGIYVGVGTLSMKRMMAFLEQLLRY